jgi:DNA mismatch repair ATPase MutS
LDEVASSIYKEGEVQQRELTQVFTPGTFVDELDEDYNSQWLLCVFYSFCNNNFGMVAIDTTSQRVLLD